MANRLSKPIFQRYDPGEPGWPARQPFTTRQWDGYLYKNGIAWVSNPIQARYCLELQEQAAREGAAMVALQRTDSQGITYRDWVFSFPARAARPAKAPSLILDRQPGWNAKGDTREARRDDFAFSFDYASYPNGGIVVGVQSENVQATDPAHLPAAVLLREEAIEVLQYGVVVATAPYVPADQQPIRLERRARSTQIVVGDWGYQLNAGLRGRVFVRALLFVSGDFVDNPQFTALTDTQKRARVGFRGVAKANGLPLKLPALQALGSYAGAGASARLSLPRPEVKGSSGNLDITLGGGAITALPRLAVRASGLLGGVGRATLGLPALACLGADDQYGQCRLGLPALGVQSLADDSGEDQAQLLHYIAIHEQRQWQATLLAGLTEHLGIACELSLTALFDQQIIVALSLVDEISFSRLIEIMLRERVALSDSLEQLQRAAAQYATNVLTGAVTRFEGFDFIAFAEAAGATYAASANGIYRVTSGAEALTAAIEFAAVGVDSGQRKRLESVYLGLDTDGDTWLRVIDDQGKDKTYRVQDRGNMQRGQMAKGITSRHWRVRLEVTDASTLDLDRVEWLMPISARRV